MKTLKSIYFVIFILIFSIPVCHITSYADSMDNPVSNEDEFFLALGRQMLNHKSNELYYISTEELKKQITVEKDFNEPFMYHYNPKDPLASGCYTYLALNSLRMTWFENKSRTLNVEMHFFVPKDTMDDYYSEMKQLSTELKRENDYESVKAVHDYLIKRVEYDYSSMGENYTDIEGLRENRMVCQGYSMATYVLLSDMGIPVRIILGTAGDEKKAQPHAWNVVQVDGKWYNYDATWDDGGGDTVNYNYFLKGKNDFPLHYPQGLYAKDEFLNMISDESYKTPGDFRNSPLILLPGLITWLIAFLIIRTFGKAKRKSTGTDRSGTSVVGIVIEDELEI